MTTVYDPTDWYYGPVGADNTTAHTPTSSAVWGPAGDAPWPNAGRRRRLEAATANLRSLRFGGLARAVLAAGIDPSPTNRRAAVDMAARVWRTLCRFGYGWGNGPEDMRLCDLRVFRGEGAYYTSGGEYRRAADGYCRNGHRRIYNG